MSFRCACSASFSRKYHLERHCEVTHGIKAAKGKAELACPLCDKVYYLKSALEKHRVKMHPEKKNEDTDDTDTRKCSVSQVLPKGYEYEILEFHNLQKGFKCKINFDIDRIEESNMFIEEFKSINSTRYRVVASRSTTDILLEKRFCCHHNSRKNRPSKKNTNCSAELLMVIKKGTLENKLLCNVTIYNEHNHETNIAAAVKFLDPSPEVVEKFEKMFENGLSPSMATFKHEEDLQLQYGGEFYKVLSNRRLCPPQVWAFTHYYKIFRKTYGEAIGEGMLTSLKNAIENLCMETNNPKCGKVIVNENGTFTVCIATPLMKRVSSTPLAGNICFLDSTGGLDRFGCRVFLMSCLSSAGGLPIVVDCQVSSWGPWSQCDAQCGPGSMSRSRKIIHPAEHGGRRCPGLLQRRACQGTECAKHAATALRETAMLLPVSLSHSRKVNETQDIRKNLRMRIPDDPENNPHKEYCVEFEILKASKACRKEIEYKYLQEGERVCVRCESDALRKSLEWRCQGHGVPSRTTRFSALSAPHCHGKWLRITPDININNDSIYQLNHINSTIDDDSNSLNDNSCAGISCVKNGAKFIFV